MKCSFVPSRSFFYSKDRTQADKECHSRKIRKNPKRLCVPESTRKTIFKRDLEVLCQLLQGFLELCCHAHYWIFLGPLPICLSAIQTGQVLWFFDPELTLAMGQRKIVLFLSSGNIDLNSTTFIECALYISSKREV